MRISKPKAINNFPINTIFLLIVQKNLPNYLKIILEYKRLQDYNIINKSLEGF